MFASSVDRRSSSSQREEERCPGSNQVIAQHSEPVYATAEPRHHGIGDSGVCLYEVIGGHDAANFAGGHTHIRMLRAHQGQEVVKPGQRRSRLSILPDGSVRARRGPSSPSVGRRTRGAVASTSGVCRTIATQLCAP